MARDTPIPRFRLDTDPINEQSVNLRVTPVSPNVSQLRFHQNPQQQQQQQSQLQSQRFQPRTRRSACSDLQSTTIPEERIYNGNRRRASLFVGRPSPEPLGMSTISSDDQVPNEYDYAKLCRQRCQSLYGSLVNPPEMSAPPSPLILTGNSFTLSDDDDDDNEDDDQDEDEDEQSFEKPTKNKFRYSLPDASPSGLGIRNFLKRNKSTNYHPHHRLCLPSHSSHSLCSSASSSPAILTHSPSPLSTFRNFLSLVKLPSSSTKSINSATSSTSTTPHHSSLTTLTSVTGGSSTTLDQTSSLTSSKKRPTTIIDTQYQWHFEVSISIYIRLIIKETTAATSSNIAS